MTLTKKNIILSISIIALGGIILSGYLVVQKWNRDYQVIIDRCIGYSPEWLGMVDCHGVISIEQPDESGYLILNNSRPGSIIAEIKAVDSFVIENNEMYLIDISSHGICNNLVPNKYCGEFQVNGETKTYYYNRPEDVPVYRIINIQTGNERFYASLSEIPATDRAMFEQLLNGK